MMNDEIKLPPHSVEAEEALLGSILINNEAFHDVASFLKPEDFFVLRHNWIWEAVLRVHERGEAIEYILIAEELRAQERLEEIGGAAYLTYLASNTPTSVHAESYGRIISRLAVRRNGLNLASDMANLWLSEDSDIDIVKNDIFGLVIDFYHKIEKKLGSSWRSTADVQSGIFDEILEAMQNPKSNGIIGIPSGLRDIDAKTRGWRNGYHYIIAGLTGTGKSSLMREAAMYAACNGNKVGIISREMNAKDVNRCMLAQLLHGENVQMDFLESGNLTDKQYKAYLKAKRAIEKMDIWIAEPSLVNINQIVSEVTGKVQRNEMNILFVDYLQLLEGNGENRTQEVSSISRKLKNLALSLNIPVISLAQLNRSFATRGDKKPQLHDLRESGSQEQDADCVLMLWREIDHNPECGRQNELDVFVRKNRRGATGQVTLYWNPESMHVANFDPREIDLDQLGL